MKLHKNLLSVIRKIEGAGEILSGNPALLSSVNLCHGWPNSYRF